MLTKKQREGIRYVTGDGARWIDLCAKEMLPNCTRCIDSFHVVQWSNDALDKERRTIWRELNTDAKTQRKTTESLDKNSKEFQAAVAAEKLAKEVKGAQYALGKAPENLTQTQQARLEFIRDTHPRLYRAYCLKCFKLPKWNGFSLKSERRLLAPPSGFIPRKVLASKLGGGLNQRSP